MSSPITWRNVEASDLRGAASMLHLAGNSINSGFDKLNQVLQNEQATTESNWKVQRDNNTQAFLNSINQYRTPEEYQAALASGALSTNQYGAQIDQAAARAALDGRLSILQDRAIKAGQVADQQQERESRPVVDRLSTMALSDDKDVRRSAKEALGIYASNGMVPKAADIAAKLDQSERMFVERGQADTRFQQDVEMHPLNIAAKRASIRASNASTNASNATTASLSREDKAAMKLNEERRSFFNKTDVYGSDQGYSPDQTVTHGNIAKGITAALGKDNVEEAQKLIKIFADTPTRTLTKADGSRLNLDVPPAIIQRAIAMSAPGGRDGFMGIGKSPKYGESFRAEVLANVDKLMQDPSVVDSYATARQLASNTWNGGVPRREAIGLPPPSTEATVPKSSNAPAAALEKAAAAAVPASQAPVTQASADRKAFLKGVGSIVDAATLPGRALSDLVGAGLNVGGRVVNAVAGGEVVPQYKSVLGAYGAMPFYDMASAGRQSNAPVVPQKPTTTSQQVIPEGQGTKVRVDVKDGDTIAFEPLDPRSKVPGAVGNIGRLNSIDANESAKPEFGKTGQRFAKEATDFLKNRVDGKEVTVRVTGQDNRKDSGTKRNLLDIEIDGVPLDVEMVREGYARVYKDHIDPSSPRGKQLLAAEAFAKTRRLGIWGKDMRGEANPEDHRRSNFR